ncbi:MAG: hypothetical protein AAGF24_04250, partial [Cyanobacteria bacterium P01_H01_bin.121]
MAFTKLRQRFWANHRAQPFISKERRPLAERYSLETHRIGLDAILLDLLFYIFLRLLRIENIE